MDGTIIWENEFGNKGINITFDENYKPKNNDSIVQTQVSFNNIDKPFTVTEEHVQQAKEMAYMRKLVEE